MSLRSDIEAAIVTAWTDSPSVARAARSEPNHVARLIGHASQPIADAIVANTRAHSVTVRSTFCHQNPYAFWQSPAGVMRCELADLLVIVRTSVHERALLLQTKMRDMTSKAPWLTGHALKIGGKALIQRELYAALPPFHLEFTGAGGPTAYDARGVGSVAGLEADFLARHGRPLRPFALASLPTSTPAGLIYAGIDNPASRTALPAPWSPWLTEPQRPGPGTTEAQFGETLADTLSDLIHHPMSNAGLPLLYSRYPDWTRLIEDLQNWANDWFSNPEYHVSNHGVTSSMDRYEPSAFDNLGHAAFRCWAAAGTASTSNAVLGKNIVPGFLGGKPRPRVERYLFARSPSELSTRAGGALVPPGGGTRAPRAEEDGARGFGIIELSIRFTAGPDMPVRPTGL